MVRPAPFLQLPDIPAEQVFCGIPALPGLKPGGRSMVRCLLIFRQPHKIHPVQTCLFRLPAGADAARIPEEDDPEQHPRFCCRFPSHGRTGAMPSPAIPSCFSKGSLKQNGRLGSLFRAAQPAVFRGLFCDGPFSVCIRGMRGCGAQARESSMRPVYFPGAMGVSAPSTVIRTVFPSGPARTAPSARVRLVR